MSNTLCYLKDDINRIEQKEINNFNNINEPKNLPISELDPKLGIKYNVFGPHFRFSIFVLLLFFHPTQVIECPHSVKNF